MSADFDDRPLPGTPERPKKPFNYVAVVGVVFVLIVAVALINALKSEDSGTVGIDAVGIGEKMPPFAVPIATSDLDGDANIDPKEACSVDLKGAMRICDYFDRPLVMSFWFTKGGSDCIDQQDVFDQLAAKYEDRAGFVSINVRDERQRVRDLIAEHGWKVPVGYDRDGAVSNIYRVGVCPTFLFIEPGGILENAEVGVKTLDHLDSQVRSLLHGSKVESTEPQP